MLNVLEAEITVDDATGDQPQIVWVGNYDAMKDRYLNGGCLAFAYALWIAHGCPEDGYISILSDDLADGWAGIDHDATHAYFERQDAEIDVCGIRSPSVMAEDFDLASWSIAATLSPAKALSVYAGGLEYEIEEGDYPIILRRDDIEDALVHIANHPKRYGLQE